MYAIVAAGGKQYKVTNGDVVKFEKLEGNAGDKVVFDQVLLISEKKVTVGDPVIAGASVEGEIVEQGKDKKVIVYKYKPKSGYHKKNGHRQPITLVKIEKVILNGVEMEPSEEETKEEAKKAKKEKVRKKAEEIKAKAAEVVEEAKDKAEEVKAKAAEAVEESKEKAEEAKEKAAEVVEEAKEKAAEAVEEAKEKAGEAIEKIKEKAEEVAADSAE